jgi:hypothetical protein
MAVVSFTIYLLVLLVAAALLIAAYFANAGSSKNSSRSRKSRERTSSGLRFRPRFRTGWLYYPFFGSSSRTGTRYAAESGDAGAYGDQAFDPYQAYRKAERKKLRSLLIALSLLFLSVLGITLLLF